MLAIVTIIRESKLWLQSVTTDRDVVRELVNDFLNDELQFRTDSSEFENELDEGIENYIKESTCGAQTIEPYLPDGTFLAPGFGFHLWIME